MARSIDRRVTSRVHSEKYNRSFAGRHFRHQASHWPYVTRGSRVHYTLLNQSRSGPTRASIFRDASLTYRTI